jgi:4-alpha-glucanotransferase
MLQARAAGLLLHPTSLPGPHGHGDFGDAARALCGWLAEAGLRWWQWLPTTPPGPGDSPYQSPSAFAGHAGFVALAPLVAKGWLEASATSDPPAAFGAGDGTRAAFAAAAPWRRERLHAAAAGFFARGDSASREAFCAFCAAEAPWLEDWALYAACKAAHGGRPWWQWPRALSRREPAALAAVRLAHAEAMDAERFVQWCFAQQLRQLRTHAAAHGVRLLGDVPIFVAHDSADVWARRELFLLDTEGQPAVVAGVPPDGFAEHGQRWGNPLYDWQQSAREGHAWWIARLRRALALADAVRLDHFLGFVRHWEIPAEAPTAETGRWVAGPGAALFDAVQAALGPLPLVAEDLGVVTPEAVALRERFGWPGMRILQEAFASGDAAHPFLPHAYERHTLAYTGTHDSRTAIGWWRAAGEAERARAAAYLGLPSAAAETVPNAALWRALATSTANLVIAPLQDFIALDDTHRMNRPGTGEGNWDWRFTPAMLEAVDTQALKALAQLTGRA